MSEDWVVSMIEPYDYPAKSGSAKTDAPNHKVFQVTGLKTGKVTIHFYQMNPSGPNTRNGVESNYIVEVKPF